MSQTELQERAHRLPKRAFQRLVDTGLLNPRGDDGRWEEAELARLDTVMQLGDRARDLHRRVVLLSWTPYPVPSALRQRAIVELLSTDLRPAPARKMREVRRRLDILHRRVIVAMRWQAQRRPRSYGLGIPRDRWAGIVRAADFDMFQREYHVAAHYAQILATVMEAEGHQARVPIPDEEVLALVLVNLLLHYPEPRRAAGVPPLPVRSGLDIED